jgi:general secretion pathway protein A
VEAFYGLREPAFGLAVDLRFVYHSAGHDRAVQEVVAALAGGEGLVLLTGPPGIGKSTVCRSLLQQLDARVVTSIVTPAARSTEAFLAAVLTDFGALDASALASRPPHLTTRADLLLTLRDFLGALAPDQSAVVIVDDAHRLAPAVFDELNTLLDLEPEKRPLQVVLAGSPELVDILRRKGLRALRRRAGAHVTIEPLARGEMAEYVAHRMAVAGATPHVEFDDRALARIHELSGGVPRVINLVCDQALAVGQRESASVIDRRLADAGVRQLDPDTFRRPRPAVRLVVVMVALALLGMAGAAAATILFRAELNAAWREWQQVPALPGPPGVRVAPLPVPVAPVEARPVIAPDAFPPPQLSPGDPSVPEPPPSEIR